MMKNAKSGIGRQRLPYKHGWAGADVADDSIVQETTNHKSLDATKDKSGTRLQYPLTTDKLPRLVHDLSLFVES